MTDPAARRRSAGAHPAARPGAFGSVRTKTGVQGERSAPVWRLRDVDPAAATGSAGPGSPRIVFILFSCRGSHGSELIIEPDNPKDEVRDACQQHDDQREEQARISAHCGRQDGERADGRNEPRAVEVGFVLYSGAYNVYYVKLRIHRFLHRWLARWTLWPVRRRHAPLCASALVR